MMIQKYREKNEDSIMEDSEKRDTGNIFSDIPENLPEEFFEDILKSDSFRAERIASDGHCSPKGFWYDQDMNEWVMVLKGEAVLLFENQDKPLVLKAGDYVRIPAHVRHRVEKTGRKTVWFAIHYQ
ncbi:MAG: cupin domain-containing protein [Desulfococcaceae bacterium]|jgi:cupin 2 domain-containing protein|nr:cupin domain-containing protein [Desulfococcaceae bacterium]